jgi:endonuclease/exonuclease/phosphatase family metal-dependent hydrolase
MDSVTTVEGEWAVMTWNIQGVKATDIGCIAAVIERERTDVVALQEIREPQVDELSERLGMIATWAFKHHPFTPLFSNRAEGAAIMTPHAISDTGHQRVSDERSTRSFKRRIAQWATVQRADHSAYRVFNVHLSPHAMEAQRLVEADRVAVLAESLGDSPPVIVAGDFNDHGSTEVIDRLPGVEHLAPPATNPSALPVKHLDHVLLPVKARNVSVSVPAGNDEWAALSDHLPLTVRFGLDWIEGDFGT